MLGAKPITPVNKIYSNLLLNHPSFMRLRWWLRPLRQAQCWWRWSAWQSQMDCAGQSDVCGSSFGSDPRFWIPHHRGFSWWWYAESGRKEAKHNLALQRKYMNKIWLSLREKLKYLGWHADWSLHLQVLLLSPTDQVGTDWGIKWKTMMRCWKINIPTVIHLGWPWLRIAYTNRQDASRRIFILIAQVCVSYLLTYSELLLTLLQRFDIAAGEGDADAVDGDLGLNRCLASVLESLHEWKQVINTSDLSLTFRRLADEGHCRDDVMPKAEHFTEKLTIFIRAYTHKVLTDERFNQKVKINTCCCVVASQTKIHT